MSEKIVVTHVIQRSIMTALMYQKVARFRDLRPLHTDTNLFSYHLQALIRKGLVQKSAGGYTLTTIGLRYVDQMGSDKEPIRRQPNIIIMLLIQNSDGDVLLQKRNRQPYIDTWTLPYGKLEIDDQTLTAAAQREVHQKLGFMSQPLAHVGDAYIRVMIKGEILSTTLAHIFRFNRDDISLHEDLMWVQPHKLEKLQLAPAVAAIVARSFFHDPFFFEEFEEEWLV